MAVLKVMQLIVIGVCIVPFVNHGSLESYAANSNRSKHCSLCKSWLCKTNFLLINKKSCPVYNQILYEFFVTGAVLELC